MLGRGLGDRVQLQQDAGQHLADLVVQVAGDADALGLLRGEHAPAAFLPLALEPVEHAVEGGNDTPDLVAAVDGQTLAGPQQVDRLHPLGEPFERRDRAPQKQAFAITVIDEPADDDQRLRRA